MSDGPPLVVQIVLGTVMFAPVALFSFWICALLVKAIIEDLRR